MTLNFVAEYYLIGQSLIDLLANKMFCVYVNRFTKTTRESRSSNVSMTSTVKVAILKVQMIVET